MNKKRFIALLGLCVIYGVCCRFRLGEVAYADNVVVPGGEGNYGTASCKSPDGYQYLCSHTYVGDRGGGMSWRIFQVPSSGYNVSGLQTWSYADLIDEDEANGYLETLIKGCRGNSNPWMVIWGWDWLNYGNNTDNILLGPAEDPGFYVAENSYNRKSLSGLSTFQNNTKISSTDALKLYKKISPKATSIPSSVRGFCADSPAHVLNSYAVTGFDSSTKKHIYLKKDGKVSGWLSSAPDDAYVVSKSFPHGSSASVTMDSAKGNYEFSNWGSSCGDEPGETADNVNRKCTIDPFNDKENVYAYYKLKQVTLRAYAWARLGDGTDVKLKNGAAIDSNTVNYGSNATVSRTKYDPGDGYTWWKWGTEGVCKDAGSSDNCTVVLTDDKDANAYWYRNEFEGQSRVSEVSDTWENIPDTKKKTTDWTQENGKTVVHNIQNCDPVNGCTVRFAHWLRRTAGGGSTTYSVSRTSNYYTISSGTVISTTTEDFSAPTTDSGDKRVRLEDFTNKLYPGQAVCETLTFKANVSVGNVSITACALALGDSQPKNPDGSSTLLKMEVSRDGGENYQEGSIYMKPGDEVKFRATYNPVLQYTANIRPEKMQINSGSKYVNNQKPCTLVYSSSINSGYCYMYEFFNAKKGSSLQNWNNAFVLSKSDSEFKEESESEKKNSTVLQVGRYDVGDTTKRESENSYGLLNSKVSGVDAGRSMSERISTNQKEWVSRSKKIITNAASTPEQVSFTNDGDKNLGNVQTELELKAIATAYVPYNFINSTSITGIENKDNVVYAGDVVYAGESETVKFDVNVGMRTNNTTDGTYSTIVREASIQLIACEGIGCTNSAGSDKRVTNDDPVVLNGSGAIDGTSSDSEEMTVHIPDISAGSWMCFRSRVYPATVKNDVTVTTDWKNNDSGYGWAESEEQCYKVAKRPNFQVWGGSIYSAGKISLKESKKNNLSGVPDYPYTISGDSSQRVFGSWTELGLTAGGEVTGLASGAGTGYGKLGRVADSEDPGGSAEGKLTNYCLRSTLSFANSGCNGNGSVGGLGGSGGDASSRSALISNFVQTGDDRFDVSGAPFDLSVDDEGHLTDRGVYYYDGGSNGLVIGGGSGIESGRTKVVRTDGNVTIADNIIYKDKVGGYTALTDIPKVIIYAKGDITIQCHVERIDAVLIADGKIDTCVTAEGEYDDESNSKRLVINGSTISDTLNLNRTYGAATGANSIEPAEIINYDTSLFLWANKQADATTSGKLTETYVRELAPRY